MMPIRLLINSVTGDILAIIGINITGGHLILSFFNCFSLNYVTLKSPLNKKFLFTRKEIILG